MSGHQGIQGAQGVQGIQGIQGVRGPKGEPGKSPGGTKGSIQYNAGGESFGGAEYLRLAGGYPAILDADNTNDFATITNRSGELHIEGSRQRGAIAITSHTQSVDLSRCLVEGLAVPQTTGTLYLGDTAAGVTSPLPDSTQTRAVAGVTCGPSGFFFAAGHGAQDLPHQAARHHSFPGWHHCRQCDHHLH